jgi:type I restriction enzyme S subunit
MELKPGYKQTEVGVIPEDWDCVSIQSAASNASNAIVGGPFGSDLTSSDYVYSGVPVVRGANMGSKMIGGSFVFVSTSKASALAANLARPQDLVFTQRGTLGQVSLVPDELFESYLISQSQMKVSLDGARYVSEYVYHYFSSAPGQKQILDSAIQTGVPHTNLGICRKYVFPAPCITEQEKICEVLNDIDSHLELIGRLLDKKKQIKQAAMQELLTGNRRLPGFEGKWKEASIGGMIDLLTGFPFPSSGYRSSGIRLLRGSNVKRGLINWNEDLAEHWPAISSDIARYELCEGDIVIAMDGALVGRSYARVQPSDLPALLLQRVARIRSSSLCNDFLFFQIGSSRFADHCDSVKTSTAIPHISPADIRNFRTFIPPTKKEQNAIAAILLDLDAELSGLEAHLDKARDLKQGMMQQLLTGKIRLT